MGTNYYHEREPLPACPRCGNDCAHCEEQLRRHIGKSSVGWTFSFQAHDDIRSYADWLRALESGGRILDEYGRVVSIEEFKALVERKRAAPHNNARDYPDDYNFTDPDGHAFSAREFS